MGNLSDIDTGNVSEMGTGFKAVPPGEYMMMIEASERKEFNGRDKLEVHFRIVGGEHDGSIVREWFEFWHSDPEVVGRNNGHWQAVCLAAIGLPAAPNDDSTSLHNKMFYAEVSNDPMWDKTLNPPAANPAKRTNKMVWRKGTIRGLKEPKAAQPSAAVADQSAQAAASSAPQQATAAAPNTVTPGKGAPPWAKK